jgi:hypothetical protein
MSDQYHIIIFPSIILPSTYKPRSRAVRGCLFLMPSYRRLQQYAIGISIISILYNAAEGAVSVALGSETSSRSLVFFGVQSGIEVISAGIVVWRFNKIAQPGEEKGLILGAKELRYVTVQ